MSLPALRPEFKQPKVIERIDTPQEFDDSGVHEDQYPSPIWANPGEQVWGTYLGEKKINVDSIEQGRKVKKPRVLYLVREDSVGTIGIWDTTALSGQMALKMPQAGDRIIIVYLGLGQKKPTMNAPHLFRVGVKRREAAKA